MTDRPTGPATYTAEEAVRFAYAQGRDDERARIFAVLPAALQRSRILHDGDDAVVCSRCQDDAAALAAAIERVIGEER